MRRVGPLALLLVVIPALGGCAALALPAASSVVAEGAGGLLKAGTEYTRSGTAHRTFALPLDEARTSALARDRSTTSEIITQLERATEQRERAHAAASPRTAPAAGTPVAPLPRRTQP